MTPQAWQLQLALGACRAGRLLALASLACALFTLRVSTLPAEPLARVLAFLAILIVLAVLYLAVRLEIDRGLFQRLAATQDANGDDLAALDRALVELGWRAGEGATRPLAARVAGVVRLVIWQGGLVAAQLVLIGLFTLAQ